MADTTDKALDALQERLKLQEAWGQSTIDTLNLWHKEREEANAAITALRAQLATARADAVREIRDLLTPDDLDSPETAAHCRYALRQIALIDTPTPSAPSPEAVARAALEWAIMQTATMPISLSRNPKKAVHMALDAVENKLRTAASDDLTIAAIITKAGGEG
jgi:hypothetical protein